MRHGGDRAFAQHAADGGAHEDALIEEKVDVQALRQAGLNRSASASARR